jgi:hypothetical protein
MSGPAIFWFTARMIHADAVDVAFTDDELQVTPCPVSGGGV